ncbi:MAG: DUF981 family protein [Candidatus Micrarchaeaceae archaeon]
MVYVDSLAVMLLSLGLSSLVIALYFIGKAANKKWLGELVVPAFALGLFDFLSGFVMSFQWPLPGSYNMLFGDPILMLGLIMMAGAYMLHKNTNPRILSIFGFFLGIYIAVELAGIIAFNLEGPVSFAFSPSNHFVTAFGLYLFAALSALFSPIAFADPKGSGKYAYYLLAILLIITALIALFIGYGGIFDHLGSPP